jgi:hypothetical protein
LGQRIKRGALRLAGFPGAGSQEQENEYSQVIQSPLHQCLESGCRVRMVSLIPLLVISNDLDG